MRRFRTVTTIGQKKPVVFLTGATGLVGSYLLKILLENGHKVFVLARGKGDTGAPARVKEVLDFWDVKTFRAYRRNVRVVEGDIAERGLGLKQQEYALLRSETEEIFHCAAVTEFMWPLPRIRKVNVGGTRNVLELAKGCARLRKVNHISTAFICGDYKRPFKETDLDVGQKFNTTYEQSKFEAELLVNKYRKKGLWIDIYRPPFVVGESKTGKTFIKKNIYQFIALWKSKVFPVFPFEKGKRIHFVPVDWLDKAIYRIAINTNKRNSNYHAFPPHMTAADLISTASQALKFRMPVLVNYSKFNSDSLTPIQKRLLKTAEFYFTANPYPDPTQTLKLLDRLHFRFPKLNANPLKHIFKYCA